MRARLMGLSALLILTAEGLAAIPLAGLKGDEFASVVNVGKETYTHDGTTVIHREGTTGDAWRPIVLALNPKEGILDLGRFRDRLGILTPSGFYTYDGTNLIRNNNGLPFERAPLRRGSPSTYPLANFYPSSAGADFIRFTDGDTALFMYDEATNRWRGLLPRLFGGMHSIFRSGNLLLALGGEKQYRSRDAGVSWDSSKAVPSIWYFVDRTPQLFEWRGAIGALPGNNNREFYWSRDSGSSWVRDERLDWAGTWRIVRDTLYFTRNDSIYRVNEAVSAPAMVAGDISVLRAGKPSNIWDASITGDDGENLYLFNCDFLQRFNLANRQLYGLETGVRFPYTELIGLWNGKAYVQATRNFYHNFGRLGTSTEGMETSLWSIDLANPLRMVKIADPTYVRFSLAVGGALYVSGTVGGKQGFFKSADGGTSWQAVVEGSVPRLFSSPSRAASALFLGYTLEFNPATGGWDRKEYGHGGRWDFAADDSLVYAIAQSPQQRYIQSAPGLQGPWNSWKPVPDSATAGYARAIWPDTNFRSLEDGGQYLWASTKWELLRIEKGTRRMKNVLLEKQGSAPQFHLIDCFAVRGALVFAVVEQLVRISEDAGETWTILPDRVPDAFDIGWAEGYIIVTSRHYGVHIIPYSHPTGLRPAPSAGPNLRPAWSEPFDALGRAKRQPRAAGFVLFPRF